MQRPRPALSVQQTPGENSRPARFSSSSTSAAWHRANSYLDSFGAHSQVEHRHVFGGKPQTSSSPSKTLPLPSVTSARRNGDADGNLERQPLLSTNGSTEQAVPVTSGASTLLQTILNSMNSLLGVGLLSLPLGVLCSGWVIGSTLLLVFALVTLYTATLLADCMKADSSCKSYVDIADKTYGSKGRLATVIIFALITITACVALVILFADSMNALLPVLTVLHWKLICALILLPLHFAPFQVLSMASVVGIGACAMTALIVICTGLTSSSQPGSLLNPAETTYFPSDWSKMPLSLGLLMSPWTAHAILPNLYADMSEPVQFRKAMSYTFSLTYLIDLSLATCGYLMYGELTTDEITYNVISASHSRGLAISLTILVAIMPITKVPLAARPLVIMTEYAWGLISEQPAHEERSPRLSHNTALHHMSRCAIRILWVVLVVFIAGLAPDFRIVMAFMGSAMCYTIAIILPILFYMKMFSDKLSLIKYIMLWGLLIISSVSALVGTVWALVGEQLLGKET